MNIRIVLGTIVLITATLQGAAQTTEQRVIVKLEPSQTMEERVADEFKEKRLRKAEEEKLAGEEANRIANTRPETVLSRARTMYINSHTDFFEEEQLQNALRQTQEFKPWGLVLIESYEGHRVADLLINIDRPLFTYTFTYQIVDRRTGIILANGKVTAFDGNFAAPKLAARIIEDIKKAKQSSQTIDIK